MCDYSLEAVKSVKAAKGDKLITTNFGRGTSGFRPAGEPLYGEHDADGCLATSENTAVCLLPGTELAFDAPVEVRAWTKYGTHDGVYCAIEHPAKTIEHKVARFAKINTDNPFTHHDGLEFPDTFGVDPVLLNHLAPGQTATVIQMPAEPIANRDELTAAGVQVITAQTREKTAPEYTD